MVRYCRLFNVLKAFSCKIGDSHVFSCSGIKVSEGFHIISNLAVTTRITINYFRADFFLKWILKLKQCVKSPLRSKNYFQFTITLSSSSSKKFKREIKTNKKHTETHCSKEHSEQWVMSANKCKASYLGSGPTMHLG